MSGLGDLAREALACWGMTFAVTASRALGDHGLGLRTAARRAGLGALVGCAFCTGFWVALACRLGLRDPVPALELCGAGLVLGGFAGWAALYLVGERSARVAVGAALLGGVALPALAAVPLAVAAGGAAAVPREFLCAVGDAGFAYAAHEGLEGGSVERAMATLLGLGIALAVALYLG